MTTPADNILAIHSEAIAAAKLAESQFMAEHGEPMYCGFAWVTVLEKGSTKLGKALKSVGFDKSYGRGMNLWNPACNHTQSMDVKEHGAMAYAKVLHSHGIKAYAQSRPD